MITMKRILIFYFLIILPASGFCQAPTPPYGQTAMLMKYWYYRDRLKREFMPDAIIRDAPGMFSPASIAEGYENGASNIVQWGDATIDLAYYMAVLGMEWRAEDYLGLNEMKAKTLVELVFALEAFDHLDGYSDPTINKDNQPSPQNRPSPDGFFVRDLLGINLVDPFGNSNSQMDAIKNQILTNLNTFDANSTVPENQVAILKSDYLDYYGSMDNINTTLLEESKDQVIQLILGLTTIIRQVPPGVQYNTYAPVQSHAAAILARIINYCHDQNNQYCWGPNCFVIYDPVNYQPVAKGYNFWTFGFPLQEIYKRYIGVDLVHPGMWAIDPDLWLQFGTWGTNNYLFTTIYGFSDELAQEAIKTLTLSVASGDPTKYVANAYALFLPSITPSSLSWFQIPIYNSMINGIRDPNDLDNYYSALLTQAPCNGPRKSSATDYPSYDWSSTSLLMHPERRGTGAFPGKYNGLDYMYLFDGVIMEYLSTSRDYLDLYQTNLSRNFPYTFNSTFLGIGRQNHHPAYIPSYKEMNVTSTLSADAYVTLRSGESVNLLPGFFAAAGSNLSIYSQPFHCMSEIDFQRQNSPQSSGSNIVEVESENKLVSLKAYPNPCRNKLTVSINYNAIQNSKIALFDVLERQVLSVQENKTINIGEFFFELDLSSLPSGVYFLKATSESMNESVKIVKQ